MMEFLYFPDDKTEYIPGLISIVICIIVAYIVFRLVKKYSKKQEEKAKAFEQEVYEKMKHQDNDNK
ncbi:hypothetical protein [Phocicoccus pinnipedialis]|uniref:Uncharacterized protein n=1 Tax=Phocicoccus pinnipedialis TaxID=110845 RepID=A0A6V7R746_9BACL|nr:hypothetical protein [Jeotgalicoccus pinnipedialis]MBP1938890.1 large-conductance mechanosensitive channel [Jeotgalicoccus pinnipedialis]CAD2073270.1 hypothetical protein JEOPIN946_00654 [Jeotgalicoccus pinnipedialis]